ncbi:ergosterol biosynthesis ERG4/ERG24 family-domain-containing protein [Aspergillus alliaceus]|uniref:7-dehydrocholesterol reductase n=1 Tax=Petromyces alliaceus TaxID=209559 RepID=A0A5N7BZ11_PETAA|nr:ergosterol biosynthesis ERG4/ERG24 family-domain-containing protein [Aspergillus alliaceus]
MNGLLFFTSSFVTFLAAVALRQVELSFIARNWKEIILALNVFAWLLTGAAFLKGRIAPSYRFDTRSNGSYIYDIWRGIELHPRFGTAWDLKIFHNARWTMTTLAMIDISFAALQYETHAYITNTMICVIFLRGLLIVHFFANEEWYLHSMDVCDEPFGFYFTWGSSVFFPTIYTLQTQYLALNPVELPTHITISIFLFGVVGFIIYYTAMEQKNIVQDTNGKHSVAGRKAKFIRASYVTTDGVERESLLFCSGMVTNFPLINWNGLGGAFATAFLAYRCVRDEKKCTGKYGEAWETYCRRVRWRLVPGLY